MYAYHRNPLPASKDDFAEALKSTTDQIRSAYERWPVGHHLHPIVPGFLARVLAEDLIIHFEGFTEDDVRSIIRQAFTAAGVSDTFADVIADAVCDDQIIN